MKLRLIHKILGGFLVVLALMAVVAVMGIIQLNKSAQRTIADPFPSCTAIAQVSSRSWLLILAALSA